MWRADEGEASSEGSDRGVALEVHIPAQSGGQQQSRPGSGSRPSTTCGCTATTYIAFQLLTAEPLLHGIRLPALTARSSSEMASSASQQHTNNQPPLAPIHLLHDVGLALLLAGGQAQRLLPLVPHHLLHRGTHLRVCRPAVGWVRTAEDSSSGTAAGHVTHVSMNWCHALFSTAATQTCLDLHASRVIQHRNPLAQMVRLAPLPAALHNHHPAARRSKYCPAPHAPRSVSLLASGSTFCTSISGSP